MSELSAQPEARDMELAPTKPPQAADPYKSHFGKYTIGEILS